MGGRVAAHGGSPVGHGSVWGAGLLAGLLAGCSNFDAAPTAETPTADAGTPDGRFTPDSAAHDSAVPDADASGCLSESPTHLLGGAMDAGTFAELTPESVGRAGGIASETRRALGDFVVAFDYSVTSVSDFPASGIAFFALDADLASVSCATGPAICALGASVPGWAVLLRFAQGAASDPAIPYVAVVDAQAFPTTQPGSPPLVPWPQVWTQVGSHATEPPLASWHTMTIRATGGRVSVAIDGTDWLTGVNLPRTVASATWGVGASTGQGAGAARIAVRNASLRCP